ncbi:MAG TPA: hypothetical protein VF575_02765 [Candidatus Saccharimonadales bacterium]
MRYAPKRVYTWSADTAYCVGLIASDGCLSKDGRHIDLTSTDIEQLNNFCTALRRDIPVASKSNASSTPAYHLQFSDVAFYDFLLAAGLTPAKSMTISSVSVPDEFYRDLLRGILDGDGCVRGYMDPRWTNSLMFYTEFASASPQFIQFIRDKNVELFGVTKGSVHQSPGVQTLRYAKKDSIKLASALYYADTAVSLSRKRLKLLNFVKQHEAAIIARNARVAEW